MTFSVHADSAWGGYLNCMTHGDDKESKVHSNKLPEVHDYVPIIPLSEYVERQYISLKHADTSKFQYYICLFIFISSSLSFSFCKG